MHDHGNNETRNRSFDPTKACGDELRCEDFVVKVDDLEGGAGEQADDLLLRAHLDGVGDKYVVEVGGLEGEAVLLQLEGVARFDLLVVLHVALGPAVQEGQRVLPHEVIGALLKLATVELIKD